MSRKMKNRESEVLRGYVRLVETMFINVFDRIRIKDIWHTKELSERMIEKKESDLADIGAWLKTENCKAWFNILGQCTERGSRKMYETFTKTHADSIKFIRRHKRKQNALRKAKMEGRTD